MIMISIIILLGAKPLRRRELIRNSSLLGAGLLSNPRIMFGQSSAASDNASPEYQLADWAGSGEFSGDRESEAHQIFWDKAGFISRMGGIPAPSERRDVVIVGGGIAGMTAAYYLTGQSVLLLDGHLRFGGNSKLESYAGTGMAMGAAYVVTPEAGSSIDVFFQDLGIKDAFRGDSAGDFTIGWRGRFVGGFWEGVTDPVYRDEFVRVKERFDAIYRDAYPELPLWDSRQISREELNRLDRLAFSQWLDGEFGAIHPHIREYLAEYCWSSFGGGLDELSAAQALNFVVADLQGTQTLPGGNGGIAKALFEKLRRRTGLSMIADAFVVNVTNTDQGADVCYFTNGQLRTVSCRKVIMAAPKFVAKHVIEGIPDDQRHALGWVGKRAYLVANVLLRDKVMSPGWDCYVLRGEVPDSDRNDSTAREFSDIAFAGWPNYDQGGAQALTLFIPQPYDGAEQLLFSPFANEKHQRRIREGIPEYLAGLGLGPDAIVGIRLTRYGHALPLARKGMIADGTLETAHRTLGNVLFAGQCNWANPCFETAFETGRQAAALV
jgi:hypothetical protein